MIPFLNLKAVNQRYAAEIQNAFVRVVDSGWYLLGKELACFETSFTKYCGAEYAVGVASGLDALTLILQAYGLGTGDEILVPSNTYIATVLAITASGAEPVFVEPNQRTHLIEAETAQKKITSRTKAIMPVHLYGQACDMTALCELADRYGLKIIDDAAQAHGSEGVNQSLPNSNCQRATGYSFYPSKNLGALADAGMVTTNDGELAEKIRALRNYGSHQRYVNKYTGMNSRMDELQAAILNIKLEGLDEDNKRRRRVADYYLKNIINSKISLPKPPQEPDNHVWHLFVIVTKQRDALKRYLEEKGIQTQIHYPVPPHKQECYQEYNHLSLPIAEQLADEVLSLPLSPVMSEEDIKLIVRAINEWE